MNFTKQNHVETIQASSNMEYFDFILVVAF